MKCRDCEKWGWGDDEGTPVWGWCWKYTSCPDPDIDRSCPDFSPKKPDIFTTLSTLKAENEKLRAELEQVKRCLEIVEHQREAAIDDMTALMAGQCCDLCAVEYCNDRGKTEMCTAFKWRGTKEG